MPKPIHPHAGAARTCTHKHHPGRDTGPSELTAASARVRARACYPLLLSSHRFLIKSLSLSLSLSLSTFPSLSISLSHLASRSVLGDHVIKRFYLFHMLLLGQSLFLSHVERIFGGALRICMQVCACECVRARSCAYVCLSVCAFKFVCALHEVKNALAHPVYTHKLTQAHGQTCAQMHTSGSFLL